MQKSSLLFTCLNWNYFRLAAYKVCVEVHAGLLGWTSFSVQPAIAWLCPVETTNHQKRKIEEILRRKTEIALGPGLNPTPLMLRTFFHCFLHQFILNFFFFFSKLFRQRVFWCYLFSKTWNYSLNSVTTESVFSFPTFCSVQTTLQ